jgi:hypothetical protein
VLSEARADVHDHLPARSRPRAQLQVERAVLRLLHGTGGDFCDADRVGSGADETERGHRQQRARRDGRDLTGTCDLHEMRAG